MTAIVQLVVHYSGTGVYPECPRLAALPALSCLSSVCHIPWTPESKRAALFLGQDPEPWLFTPNSYAIQIPKPEAPNPETPQVYNLNPSAQPCTAISHLEGQEDSVSSLITAEKWGF